MCRRVTVPGRSAGATMTMASSFSTGFQPLGTTIIPMICVLLHHILYVEESIVPARGSEIARVTSGISNVYRTANRHRNRYRARIGGQCAGRKTETVQIRIIHIKDAGIVGGERDSSWNLAARIHGAG